MSDDCCCGDMEECCNGTEAECNYTGRECDDSVPCMDTCSCDGISAYIETTFSDSVDVCVDQPYETYSCNVDCGNENTYRPVYSCLSMNMNNNTEKRNSTECAIISMINFRRYYAQKREKEYETRLKWIIAIGFVLFTCKVNVLIFLCWNFYFIVFPLIFQGWYYCTRTYHMVESDAISTNLHQ